MPTAYLRSRLEERAQIADLMTDVLDKAAEAKRDVTSDEQKLLDKWENRAAALDDEIKRLETVERGNQAFQAVVGRVGIADEREERQRAQQREAEHPRIETRSVGEMFVNSEEFKRYNGGGSSQKVEFDGFLEERAAITTDLLSIPAYVHTPNAPTFATPLLNVIGREVVSSGNVEYITWGPVSEAQVVAEGALKPEATLVPTPANDALDTYAHWKAISRQALEDAPRIQSIVETHLRQGLAKALATAATGVLNAATGFIPVAADDLYKGIRVGVGEVQEEGWQPNAVLVNPSDFADLDINTAADANAGPNAFSSYWGVTPVPVPGIASGTAYVGDFKEALTWFDRNRSAVYLTDSHADYFIRNLLVVLAETRALFAVTNATAAAKITWTPTTAAAAAKASK